MNARPRSTVSRPTGFTRLDLLTGASALAVLVALQAPLIGSNAVHSKAASCVENFQRLTLAIQMYASDSEGWLPPNPDDGNTIPGRTWVPGQSGPGGGQEFNSDLLADPQRSLLANYLRGDPTVFRCPTDTREGRYQGNLEAWLGQTVRAARSVAMNAAVGTNPYADLGKRPIDGPWLDNSHGHFYGQRWLTYGRESQFTLPGPAMTSLLIDEDEQSINDGTVAFGMVTPEWIDWPATRHDTAGTLSFADGHVELHRWVDDRTRVLNKNVSRRAVPGSVDYFWLRDRTSAPIPGR